MVLVGVYILLSTTMGKYKASFSPRMIRAIFAFSSNAHCGIFLLVGWSLCRVLGLFPTSE